jgi:RHS repeat-associated protein
LTGTCSAAAWSSPTTRQWRAGRGARTRLWPARLASRTRGGQGLSWEYDGDGNRTRFTDAHGTTTIYTRDAAGRLAAVSNPSLGEAAFTHDASGRLTSATSGDLVQESVYRYGSLSEHSRTDRTDLLPADVTLIGRDGDGRITAQTRAGAATRYGYDGAGQMVSAATTRNGDQDNSVPAAVSEWEYDARGRLLREALRGGSRVYDHDAAGQLLSVTEPDGTRTEYVHDGLGRRTRLIGPDGSWTEYARGPTGHLKSTVDRTPDGAELSRHELWLDALGELAAVDRSELWWDTAAVSGLAAVLPAGVTLTGNGGLDAAGLEWLGARAYDPVTRGFLSTDPLAPVLGTGWDGNPYAYAGNNPLNTTDPSGLKPLTDDELKAYDKSAGSHWEYVVAGLAVAGAVAAMFVPGLNIIAAGAIAGALAPGGISAFSQKAQKGSVDWWSVLGNTAVGAVTGLQVAAQLYGPKV